MSDATPAAATAKCLGALPEDIIVEILARVPDPTSLFRCAVVCRQWSRLVSDPAFLRRRRAWPESSLVGFFVNPQKLVRDALSESCQLAPTDGPDFVAAAPGSAALGPGHRRLRLASFVRDDGGVQHRARPLAARGGLLLTRLAPRPGDENRLLRLCVCNLLTGKLDLLPPLDGDGLIEDGVGGYAVLTAADHDGASPHRPADGYSTYFQVILAGVCYSDLQGYLVMFSSDSASSKAWSYCCVPGLSSGPYGNRVAAVTRGVAHWLVLGAGPNGNSLQILHVSIDTGHVGATEILFHGLPDFVVPEWSNTWLCPSVDGRLSFFHLDNNQLRVWSQQEDEDGGGNHEVWHLIQAIQVGTELGFSGTKVLSTVCIGEKSSTVLALDESDPEHPYVLHLQSRSKAMLSGWERSLNYVPAVPCEMDLLEFLASRLGVQV